jgi:hypothetical protein
MVDSLVFALLQVAVEIEVFVEVCGQLALVYMSRNLKCQ